MSEGEAQMTEQERQELLTLRAERRKREEREPLHKQAAAAVAKWLPKMMPFIVAGLVGGGTAALILMGGNEAQQKEVQGEVENNFFELVGHLPTIGLILVISLAADYLAKLVMSRKWFDEHGSAIELGTIRNRIGTEAERPQDGLAAGLGFVGNRLFAAAVAAALLMHFS